MKNLGIKPTPTKPGTKSKSNNGFRNIVKVLNEATPEERDYWGRWYPNASAVVRQMAEKYKLPFETVAGVVAVMSPGNRWHQNVEVARQVILWWLAQQQVGPNTLPQYTRVGPPVRDDGGDLAEVIDFTDPNAADAVDDAADEQDDAFAPQPRTAQLGRPYTFEPVKNQPKNAPATVFREKKPRTYPLGHHGPTPAGYPANVDKALKILDGADPLSLMETSPKVSVFYRSLVDPESVQNELVLDGHAINIWRGQKRTLKGLESPTEAERAQMLADYKKAAERSGLPVQAVQAITWFIWKNVTDAGDDDSQEKTAQARTAKSATTSDASRDIVVTIPKAKLKEVEQEEADVARRLAAGETNIVYYWTMGQMPKSQPNRIYFAWDGAVRAYHQVVSLDREAGRVYMDPKIHEVAPEPIQAFRGFRYYTPAQGKTAETALVTFGDLAVGARFILLADAASGVCKKTSESLAVSIARQQEARIPASARVLRVGAEAGRKSAQVDRTARTNEAYAEVEKYVDTGAYITFSDVPKFGTNPKYSYATTPYGFYGYPLTRTVFEDWRHARGFAVKYAAERQWVLVWRFKDGANVLEFGRGPVYAETAQLDAARAAAAKVLEDKLKFRLAAITGTPEAEHAINEFAAGRATVGETYTKILDRTARGHFLTCVQLFVPPLTPLRSTDAQLTADTLIQTSIDYELKNASARTERQQLFRLLWVASNYNVVTWNKKLREDGWQGVADSGTGTVHPNEPMQGVALDPRVIEPLTVVANPQAEDPKSGEGRDEQAQQKLVDAVIAGKPVDILAGILAYDDWRNGAWDLVHRISDADLPKLLTHPDPRVSMLAKRITRTVENIVKEVRNRPQQAGNAGSMSSADLSQLYDEFGKFSDFVEARIERALAATPSAPDQSAPDAASPRTAAGPTLGDPTPVTKGLLPYLKERKFDSARNWQSIQAALGSGGWAALLQRVGSTPEDFEESEQTMNHEFYDLCARIDDAISQPESEKIAEFLHRYDPMEAPSWAFFNWPKIVRPDTWLIHFTADARSVRDEGFTRGIDDVTQLGLTTHLSDDYKSEGGYSFAYVAGSRDSILGPEKYGREAVMFRAVGVQAYHSGDREDQVIFWGASVDPSGIVALTYVDGEYCVAAAHRSNSGRECLYRGTLEQVVNWVKANFNQYRKHITGAAQDGPSDPPAWLTGATRVSADDAKLQLPSDGGVWLTNDGPWFYVAAMPLSAVPRVRPWSPSKAAEYADLDASTLPPIVVEAKPDGENWRYEIVDGEHRVYAARLAKLPTIPAYVGYPVEYRRKSAHAARRKLAAGDIVYHGSRNTNLVEEGIEANCPDYDGGIGCGVYVAFDRDVAQFYAGPTGVVYQLQLKIGAGQILWLTPDNIDTSLSEYLGGSILPGENVAPFSFDLKGQRYSVVNGSGGADDGWYMDIIVRGILEQSDWYGIVNDFGDATDDVYEHLRESAGLSDVTPEQDAALLQEAQRLAPLIKNEYDQAHAQAERMLGLCISLDEVGNEAEHAGYRGVYLEGIRGGMPGTELLVFSADDLEMVGIDDPQVRTVRSRSTTATFGNGNYWVDPEGSVHRFSHTHDAWALRERGDTANGLLDKGWIRVAPPDAVQVRQLGGDMTAKVERIVRTLLAGYPDRAGVWVETDDDNHFVGRAATGRPDFSSLRTAEVRRAGRPVRTAGRVWAFLRDGETPGSKAGVFLRIPRPLADQFPKKRGDDESPAHFTLAYILGRRASDEAVAADGVDAGEPAPIVRGKPTDDQPDMPPLNDRDRADIVTAVNAAISDFPTFDLALEEGVGWFENQHGDQIANKSPAKGTEGEAQLTALATRIREALGAEGFVVSHADKPFLAHATLDYLPTRTYTGPVPEGRFDVESVELWGWPETWIFDLDGAPAAANNSTAKAAAPVKRRPKIEYEDVCPHCDEVIYEKHVMVMPPDFETMKHRDCGGIIEWSHDQERTAQSSGELFGADGLFDSFDDGDADDGAAKPPPMSLKLGDRFKINGKGPTWVVTVARGADGCVARDGQKKWFGFLHDRNAGTPEGVIYIYPITGSGDRSGPDVATGAPMLLEEKQAQSSAGEGWQAVAGRWAGAYPRFQRNAHGEYEEEHANAPGQAHPHADGAIPGVNEQVTNEAGQRYRDLAQNWGTVTPGAKSDLRFYDYRPYAKQVDDLIRDHGYEVYYAGGQYGKPDLANRNYQTGHLMVYDPSPGSGGDFGDEEYTRTWRSVHELAHAKSLEELNQKYGEGRRIGKLGWQRTPREAKRAVEWEWLAAHKQRELSEQMGYYIDDETFNKEINTVLHDAVHRAITGQFTNPDQEGFVPSARAVPLEVALAKIDEAARALGLEDDDALLTPEQKRQLKSGRTQQGIKDLRLADVGAADAPPATLYAVVTGDALVAAAQDDDFAMLQREAEAYDPRAPWTIYQLDNVPVDLARKLLNVHSGVGHGASFDSERALVEAQPYVSQMVAERAMARRAIKKWKQERRRRRRLVNQVWYKDPQGFLRPTMAAARTEAAGVPEAVPLATSLKIRSYDEAELLARALERLRDELAQEARQEGYEAVRVGDRLMLVTDSIAAPSRLSDEEHGADQ